MTLKPFFVAIIMSLFLTGCSSDEKQSTEPAHEVEAKKETAAVLDKTELLETYFEVSGLNDQLETIPENFVLGIRSNLGKSHEASEEQLDAISSIARGVLDEERIQNDLESLLIEQLSVDLLEHQINWHQSSLGEKITREETQSSDPGQINHVLENQASLLEQETRLAIAKEMNTLTKMVERSVDSALRMQSLIVKTSQRPEPVKAAFLEKLEAQKPLFRQSAESFVLANLVYTYRNLTEEELYQYLAFLKQEPSKKHIEIMSSSMDQVMNNYYAEFAHKFATYLDAIPANESAL